MTEEWRKVPSVPRLWASDKGRLKLEPIIKQMPKGGFRAYIPQPTFGQWDGKRYIWTHKGKSRKVARLVCEAFSGPAPTAKSVCMHLDENSRNNNANNLRWGTQMENLNAPKFIEYCKTRTGDNNPRKKGIAKNISLVGI